MEILNWRFAVVTSVVEIELECLKRWITRGSYIYGSEQDNMDLWDLPLLDMVHEGVLEFVLASC